MKKTIAGTAVILFSLVFLLCLLPGGAQAAETVASGQFSDNLAWVLDSDGVLTVSGRGEMDASVPWSGYTGQILRVVIRPGVSSICSGAFQGCTGLTSVTIPRSVADIYPYAFDGCSGLTDVYFGGTAGEWSCVCVVPVNEQLSGAAMHFMLGSGVCGDDLTWTLSEDGLLTVSGTGTMDDFDDYFAYMQSPDGVYPEWADLSTRVTAVELEPGVTGIGRYAFSGFTALRTVTLPGTLTTVGECAFFNCLSLTDVYCAFGSEQWSSVTMGADNGWLTEARLSFLVDAGVCGTGLTWALYSDGEGGLLQISGIGPMDDFNSYGSTPWYNNEYRITGVELRPGVTTIGYGAFLGCYCLTEVSIPDGLTLIESHAFSGCSRLTDITLPVSLVEIGSQAFGSCYSLRDVYFRGTAEDWDYVWVGTDNEYLSYAAMHFLLGAGVCGDDLVWRLDDDGALTITGTGFMPDYSATDNDNLAPWAGCSGRILTLELRPGVPNIGENAFAGCFALRSVTIPASLTDVRGYAFSGCSSLADVYYGGTEEQWEYIYADLGNDPLYAAAPHYLQTSGACGTHLAWALYDDGVLLISGVGEMDDYDYSYNNPTVRYAPWDLWSTGITEAILRPGAASIGDYAFYHCVGLASVTIPATVADIGTDAFGDCCALQDVYYGGTLEQWYGGISFGMGNERLDQAAIHCPLAFGTCGDGLVWTLDETGLLTISGEGDIDTSGFLTNYATRVLSAELTPGVTGIGGSVFLDCSYMTSITIPETVMYIGQSAFAGCSSLGSVFYGGTEAQWEQIQIASSNEALDRATVHFTLGSGVCGDGLVWTLDGDGVLTVSGEGDMYDFTYDSAWPEYNTIPWYSLRDRILTLVIRPGVTGVGDNAFRDCADLTEATIPAGTERVGQGAFGGCESLHTAYVGREDQWNYSVSIGSNNEPLTQAYTYYTIASGVCTNRLTWILYSNGLMTVYGRGSMADFGSGDPAPWYSYKDSITSLVLEDGVTGIGSYAFSDCYYLYSVTLPASVRSVGSSAFSGCYCLYDVYYGGVGEPWYVVDVASGNDPLTGAVLHYTLAAGTSGDVRWTLDGGGLLTVFGTGEMADYDSASYVPWYPYSERITEAVLAPGVQNIGDYAFAGCTGLRRISIPGSVCEIGDYALYGCTGLWSVTLPAGLSNVGAAAFCGCDHITDVYYGGTREEWNAYVAVGNDNPILRYGCIHFLLGSGFCGNGLVWTLDEDGVLTVTGDGEMYDYSFSEYPELDVPPWYSLRGDILTLVLGPGVTSVGQYAFRGCEDLECVRIPGSVSGIGYGAFSGCDRLYTVYFDGPEYQWSSLYIGSGNEPLGSAAVYYILTAGSCGSEGCDLRWTISTNGRLTVSGTGDMADYSASGSNSAPWYSYKDSITSLVVEEGVESIGSYAFSDCYSLYSVTLPASVRSVGSSAFSGCYCLYDVYYGGVGEPWYVVDVASGNDPLTGAVLHYTLAAGTSGDVRWTLDGGGLLTVFGTGEMADYTGQAPWYAYRNGITALLLEEGVTSVGAYAFADCGALSYIMLPESLQYIDAYAFTDCTSLTQLTVPAGTLEIGECAFTGCTGLTELTVLGQETAILAQGTDFAPAVCAPACSAAHAYAAANDLSFTVVEGDLSAHIYDAYEWTWNEELTEATLTLFCARGDDALVLTAQISAVTTEAACSAEGSTVCTATAAYDGETWTQTRSKTLPALGHDWGEWAVTTEPSCTADGVETRSCARCHESETRPVGAPGHDYTATVTAPTCTAGGCTTHTCSRCGDSYTDEPTDPLGHLSGGPVHENEAAPTYTEAGGYDEVEYCCRCGLELSRTHVTVPALTVEPLEITADLEDFSGPEGSTVSFTVEASGTDLSYQWYVKSRTASRFSKSSITEATYSVQLTAARSGNQLYCVVTDAYGNTARTNTVCMTIAATLEITADLTDYVGSENSTVTFTVEALGEGLTYQWYVKKPTAVRFSKSSITEATYSVQLTEARNGNQVYCVVTDAYGNTVQTNIVSMTIAAPLAITADLADYTGPVGSTASFTVEAVGDGLSYQWWVKKPTATKFSKSSITSDTYSVELTEARNGNRVYCVVTDAYGNTARTNTVSMTIAATMEITADLTDYVGSENSTVTFTVEALGEGLTYQWYVKKPTAVRFSKSSITEATYSVQLTEARNGNQVYCVVTDAYGNTARTNTVSMTIAAPLEIAADLEDFSGPEGSTVTFTVEASGTDLRYQWYIKNRTASKFSKSSITSDTYSVTLTEINSGRQLYCVVTDAYGNTARTNTVSMTIAATMEITADLTDYVGSENSTVTFTVEALGEGLTYQWYVKKPTAVRFSKSSITEATYSVQLTEARNGNQVYCVVTDAYGNTVQTNTVSMTIG